VDGKPYFVAFAFSLDLSTVDPGIHGYTTEEKP
jgi:hypothetical protein